MTLEVSDDFAPDPEELAVLETALTTRPGVFALCELTRDEEGELVDGHVAAWGLELPDRAEVVDRDGGGRGSFRSATRAAEVFALTGETRLMWTQGS